MPSWNSAYKDNPSLFNWAGKAFHDYWSEAWNDYRELYKWRWVPFLGEIASARQDELRDIENTQYWKDYAKNWGIDTSDWKYPIRQGLYGNSNPYATFNATAGIVYRQFSKRLYKW